MAGARLKHRMLPAIMRAKPPDYARLSTPMAISETLVSKVIDTYARSADDVRVVYSPLRICPLGAHVDHQLGLVCGFALDQGVHLAFAARDDDLVQLRSTGFEEPVEFRLGAIPPRREGYWGNYAAGAAEALVKQYGIRRGLDGFLSGSLPSGGLGSSGAVGVAYLLALEAANELIVSPEENIELDRYTENVYLGVNNGILDQSMTLLNSRGRLLFLDCETSGYETIAPGAGMPDPKIVVAYSGHSDSLVTTDYNKRVAECQEAARQLLAHAGEEAPDDVRLRNVPEQTFEEHADKLDPKLKKRATHFFTECARVRDGVEAWEAGDLDKLGQLIRQSGHSSIENYECGRPELVTLYDILNETPGVVGARFSGAGFRGSCIGLVTGGREGDIRDAVLSRYAAKHPSTPAPPDVFFCNTDDGARIL